MKVFKDFPLERPKNLFLDRIESPEDLKKLTIEELKVLADELREFLLFSVTQQLSLFFQSQINFDENLNFLQFVFQLYEEG